MHLVDRRCDQPPVDAHAAAEPGDEERRRPADRRGDRAEAEERHVLAAGAVGEHAVAADGGDAVRHERHSQHAEVVGDAVAVELLQPAGHGDAAALVADADAGEVEPPLRQVERRRPRDDHLEVVDLHGQPGERRAAVDAGSRSTRVPSAVLDGRGRPARRRAARTRAGSAATTGRRRGRRGRRGRRRRRAGLETMASAGLNAGASCSASPASLVGAMKLLGHRVARRVAERDAELVELEVAADADVGGARRPCRRSRARRSSAA